MKESNQFAENNLEEVKRSYTAPMMTKHDPIKILQGSGGGCSGLYYTSLYGWCYYSSGNKYYYTAYGSN